MSAQIIDGKRFAKEIKDQIKNDVEKLKSNNIIPGLATLLVGEDPASQIYVKSKHKACSDAGITSYNHVLPPDVDMNTVLKKCDELNNDPKVHAILIQLPLPPQINSEQILNCIDPKKDVDGFHPINLGRLFTAKDIKEIENSSYPIPIPCTPQGVIALIKKTGTDLTGKKAVVIGRSMIVGKPVAALLLANHSTVTIIHSRTKNLVEYTAQADIVVAAIGKPKMLTKDLIKEGSVVIDVGINRDSNGKLCGDVDFDSVKEKAGWITPVPGGVGPMTIAMLLKNTVQCAARSK